MDWDRYLRKPVSRRTFLFGTLGAAVSANMLSACGGTSTSELAPGADSANPYPEDVVEKAKEEGKVVLYTSLDTGIVESIIRSFKKRFGIPVEFFRAGTSQVVTKVLQEAQANRLAADVMDSSDVAAFIVMKEQNILAEYESPFQETMNEDFFDPDGTWKASRLTHGITQWNTDLVEDIPRSWEALTDSSLKGELAFFVGPGGDSGPRLFAVAESLGWEILERLAKNDPLRTDTPQNLTQILEQGERSVGFAQNDNIAWSSKQEGRPTDYLYLEDGVPTEPGAVGLNKNADHPNAGLLFLNWWLGDVGQDLLVQGGKYSPRSDINPPEGSPRLSEITSMPIDYEEYAKNRDDVLARMGRIFGGTW